MNSLLLMVLLACVAASLSSGVVGTFIVVRRIVFLSGGIAHAVLSGIGVAMLTQSFYGWTWCTPFLGALGSALFFSVLLGMVHMWYKEREDTIIAAIWSFGMSIGVICISLTPGYNVEMMNYLFGNILWVSERDLLYLFILDFLIILILCLFKNRMVAVCFDEVQSQLQKVPVTFIYTLLLILISFSIVLLIQVVGAILVITMLTIPTALANQCTSCFVPLMCISVLIGMALSFAGVGLAYMLNWPAGASIALLASGSFLTYHGVIFCKKRLLKNS